MTGEGLDLPAGIAPVGRAARLIGRVVPSGLSGPRPEVPCFLPWSEVVRWSYWPQADVGAGVQVVELSGPRRLQRSDEDIGGQTTTLLDAVRSVGTQSVEVKRSTGGDDISGAIQTS